MPNYYLHLAAAVLAAATRTAVSQHVPSYRMTPPPPAPAPPNMTVCRPVDGSCAHCTAFDGDPEQGAYGECADLWQLESCWGREAQPYDNPGFDCDVARNCPLDTTGCGGACTPDPRDNVCVIQYTGYHSPEVCVCLLLCFVCRGVHLLFFIMYYLTAAFLPNTYSV